VRDVGYWASASTVIVRGTVVGTQGVRGGRPLVPIWTVVEFRVTDVIKGSLSDSMLIFDVPGGTVGDETIRVFGSGPFPKNIGEEAILFLTAKSGEDSWWSPRGLALESDPLRGGVVFVQGDRIYHAGKLILAKDYVKYLRVIGRGEKISLEAFLQSPPSSESTGLRVGSSHSGSAAPVDQVGRFDKPKTLAPLPSGSEQVPTEGIPVGDAKRTDSAVKPDTGENDMPTPAGPASPPPQANRVSD
jgi:hypothetical protein